MNHVLHFFQSIFICRKSEFLSHIPFLGWQKSAILNTVGVVLISAILVISTTTALVQAKGFHPLIIYCGVCGMHGSRRVAIVVHLVINIVSTCILASSNFFIQVLNSPSREELDIAHSQGSWLDVGVPSIHNALRVSRLRTLTSLGFLVTSLPIHLFFNSAVFETDYRGSSYELAIVTESFLGGAKYYPPGTSLLNSGGVESFKGGYGSFVAVSDYQDKRTDINKRIARTAETARSWKHLNSESCWRQYSYACSGISESRNLVVVTDVTDGWTLSNVWNLTREEARFWTQYVPSTEHNPLWFYGICNMSISKNPLSVKSCNSNCLGALQTLTEPPDQAASDYSGSVVEAPWTWYLPFYDDQAKVKLNGSHGTDENITISRSGFQSKPLEIKYCLSETWSPKSCKVGLSTYMLTVVMTCALIKTILSIFVIAKLRTQNLLVTLGDSIASYIVHPDSITTGMCLTEQTDICCGKSKDGLPQGPRMWSALKYKKKEAVPTGIWRVAHLLLILLLLCTTSWGFGARSSQSVNDHALIYSGGSLITAAITANCTQLILSIAYFAHNNLQTRYHLATEWASSSTKYAGLRVTQPRGSQISTYRLQLPYRTSVPLIFVSAALHWLMSNTIYTYFPEGEYFIPIFGTGSSSFSPDPGLPTGATAAVGFSGQFFPALFSLSFIVLISSVVIGTRRIPGAATLIGCNSLAISSACHISPLSRPDPHHEAPGDVELNELLVHDRTQLPGDCGLGLEGADERKTRQKIAESKLRWGVVKMPPEWYQAHASFEQPVGHISFGTSSDDVASPKHGHWYL